MPAAKPAMAQNANGRNKDCRGAADELKWRRQRGQDLWTSAKACSPPPKAGNVGNLFQYAIAMPVSLPRQQSAMLPIVNAEVKGEKVSIYNAGGPGASTRSTACGSPTPTDLYLMQGPDHGLRRRRLRRRCQDRRPPARQPAADQLRAGPGHRSRPAEQEPAGGTAERAAAEGDDDYRPQVRPLDGVHGEELGQAGKERARSSTRSTRTGRW